MSIPPAYQKNLISPQNIIFTGVAGTGKTFCLQQIAKQYTKSVIPLNQQAILDTLFAPLNWREVICLVFLYEHKLCRELLTVNNIIEHSFFQTKARLNSRVDNLKSTARSILQQYTPSNSSTVICKNRSSVAFFDKDSSSNWYLLPEALILLADLQLKLDSYLQYTESQSEAVINHNEYFSFVSFHQSYGYDEFVEGIRPTIDEVTGQMRYNIRDGIFLQLCEQARKNPQQRYAMLIDEINRANVSQVFGELLSLIEPTKRVGQSEQMSIKLAYSGRSFSVPSNIDIYASMNTHDNSLVMLDTAFRRRFEFVEMKPNSSILTSIADVNGELIDLGKLLDGLNKRICYYLGEQYQLGHSYLYKISNIATLLKVMVRQILPYLISCASHNPQVLESLLMLSDRDEHNWLVRVGEMGIETDSLSHSSLSSVSVSYQINPYVLGLIDGSYSIDDSSISDELKTASPFFKSLQAFKMFY